MRDLTIVMAYYENPTMLVAQLEAIRRFSKEVRQHLRLVVVDDGSPEHPAIPGDCGCPLQIFRIDVDVRWNQDAARNIGVHHTDTPWFVITDMDHMVPERTAQYCMALEDLDEGKAYKFGRVTAPRMEPYKQHPNSYLMHRRVWNATGGYDERFAGYYGTDADFRDRVNQVSSIETLPVDIVRVPRDYIADASTTRYERKAPQDGTIRRIKGERNAIPGWRPVTLSFPYHRVFPAKAAAA